MVLRLRYGMLAFATQSVSAILIKRQNFYFESCSQGRHLLNGAALPCMFLLQGVFTLLRYFRCARGNEPHDSRLIERSSLCLL